MSFYLGIGNNPMEFKYYDSLSIDKIGKGTHMKTKIENPIETK